jgi:hypothetical protein
MTVPLSIKGERDQRGGERPAIYNGKQCCKLAVMVKTATVRNQSDIKRESCPFYVLTRMEKSDKVF